MLIDVKDVQKGDELLLSSGGLIYVKVLETPTLGNSYKTKTGLRYSNVNCSTAIEEIKITSNWTRKDNLCSSDEHNKEIKIDMNYRKMWLIKRETI